MNLIPDITIKEFDEHFRLSPHLWKDAVREICDVHNIHFEDFQAFSDGSNLVSLVANQIIVKIFPPFHRHQWQSERRVLHQLRDQKLYINIPKLKAEGELQNGWTYLLMNRLPGQTLETAWPDLNHKERENVLRDIGKIMSQIHKLSVGALKDLEPRWDQFLVNQRQNCRKRHERLGMPSWFLKQLDDYIENSWTSLKPKEHVILTGEYTPFNLLVEKQSGTWKLTGMIDFGDAMVGDNEYDFDGPLLFLAAGTPDLLKALFEGYSYISPLEDNGLKRRLMLYALLHRYSNLRGQICILDWEKGINSFQELEDIIFLGSKKN